MTQQRIKPPKPAPDPAPDPAGAGSDEDFTFDSSLGPITLPSVTRGPTPNALAMSVAQMAGDKGTIVVLLTQAKAPPAMFALLCKLPNDELEEFYTAWGAHSGITPGESPAS